MLKIAVVNLMPTKRETETQLKRCLSGAAFETDVTFLRMESHKPKHPGLEYLTEHYKTFGQIKNDRFDGMIITGAPVEHLPFEAVDYWDELTDVLEWARAGVTSVYHICWAAQAALYYYYGIPKEPLPRKLFGVYEHRRVKPEACLFKGMGGSLPAPQSRHTELRAADLTRVPGLEILSDSPEAGVYIAAASGGRQVYVTGHPEYDPLTLKTEYERDLSLGRSIGIPVNYFPDNDPSRPPAYTWREHGEMLYRNWVEYYAGGKIIN